MKIALLIPNVLRDLHGMVLLASALAQRGVTCYLVPGERWLEVFALAPDAIMLHQLRSAQTEFVSRFLDAGIDLFVLDVEGMERLPKYARMNNDRPEIKRQVRRFMAWGNIIGDYLRTDGGYTPEQVVITGSPRHDFYARQWHAASLAVNPESAAIAPPMILINTNTPYANHPNAKHGIDAAAADGATLNMTDELRREKALQTSAMHGMLSVVDALTARFPSVSFVLRPHPFEDIEMYQTRFGGRDNLRVIRRGSVDGWILRSTAVVQRSCSTAVESALSGIPSLSPHWFPAMDYALPDSVSIQTHSIDELCARLESALAGDLALPDSVRATLDQAIHDWFYAIDGRSHVRAADAIGAGASGRGAHIRACLRELYRVNQPRKGIRRTLERQARYHLRLTPEIAPQTQRVGFTPALTHRYFDLTHVECWVNAIHSAAAAQGEGHAALRVRHTERRDLIAPMTCASVVVEKP
jgi:surface carbohydrate biosynthesis protein